MKRSAIISGTFIIVLLMFSTGSSVLSEKTYDLSSTDSHNTIPNNKIIERLEGPERIIFGRFTDVTGPGYIVPMIGQEEYEFLFTIIPSSFYIYTQGDGSVTINGETRQGDYKYTVRGFVGIVAFAEQGLAWGRALIIKIEQYTPGS